ncbi:MAG: hypothetical protein EOP34_05775, partial [Rickettsiales bacterium]
YRDEERRNGMTVFFWGQGFTFLGGFYFLNRFFQGKRVIHLIWFLISFYCLFFLTQSRMNLIALGWGSLFLYLNSDFKRKFLVAFLLAVLAISIYSNTSIFKGIKDENKSEAKYYKDNIRFLSQQYYLVELQRGLPTILFGNGVPGKQSKLGNETENAESIGYYTSDVGLIGIYSYFGVFGAILWCLFFFSVFTMNKLKSYNYIKSYFI